MTSVLIHTEACLQYIEISPAKSLILYYPNLTYEISGWSLEKSEVRIDKIVGKTHSVLEGRIELEFGDFTFIRFGSKAGELYVWRLSKVDAAFINTWLHTNA